MADVCVCVCVCAGIVLRCAFMTQRVLKGGGVRLLYCCMLFVVCVYVLAVQLELLFSLQ